MNDFGRLLVGVAMLGLAIFLVIGWNGPGGNQTTIPSPNGEINGQSGDAAFAPNWQAPLNDNSTNTALSSLGNDLAKPVFDSSSDTRTRTSFASNRSDIAGPLPQVPDQYRAMAPFQVKGATKQGNSLVPVQPKPGFSNFGTETALEHIVQSGETLQSIASDYYGSADRYLDIYHANKHILTNPAQLPDGIALRIPQ